MTGPGVRGFAGSRFAKLVIVRGNEDKERGLLPLDTTSP